MVQRVFINHDTDLIDVTLAVHPATKQTKPQQVVVVSHGSHAPPATTTEVVHTTQKHPWLTTKGWITAGQLHLGDQVQQLDGSTATVLGLKIIPGAASMYDLTVSNVHTFAVGAGQFVVHNTNGGCGVTPNEVDSYGKLSYRQAPGDGLLLHHMPANGVIKEFGIATSDGAAVAIPDAVHAGTRTFRYAAIPIIRDVKNQLLNGAAWNKVFRSQLASDLWDLHGSVSNDVLQNVADYWRNFAPFLMRR